MKRIASWARPSLDVRDLEVALALAAAGSTTKAAKDLHITQSAVSRALVVVEEKLGVPIFRRSARGLAPTPQGARLIDAAGPILAQLSALERSVREPETPARRLRIVCECYTAYRWLPSTLTKLRDRLPGLDVTLAVEHTRDPAAALAAGDIDIALLTTASAPRGAHEQPLFSDEIVFVMAKSHPLAAKASVTPRDLAKTTLITSNTPPAEAAWFMRSTFGAKPPALSFLQLPLTEAIVDAARAGMGVAVLSEWIASVYLGADDLVMKRLATRPLRRPWRIAYRPDMSDAAQRLATALEGSAPRVYSSAG